VNGTLIFFNPAKGHGYIRTENGERLLVHAEGFSPGHLLGDRCAGTRLDFDRIEPDGGDEPYAINVEVVPLVAARRARARHR
jgi:cold shock CspA family protein